MAAYRLVMLTARRKKISLVTLDFEHAAHAENHRFVAGVDEVGRGALAGPVVAAAVILDLAKPLPEGLNDSKQLSRACRERIAEEIKNSCLSYAVAQIEAAEIDCINILQATKRAMLVAIEKLNPPPDLVLIDAVKLDCPIKQKSIIRGDAYCASIAAASIVAKVYRDDLMRDYDRIYPHYNFKSHVGYGTATHLSALRTRGACAIHRLTFKGVK